MLRHRQHEGGLTHRGTGSNDDEVWTLPTGSDLVQRIETGRDTGNRTGVLCRFLHAFEGFLDDGVDLRYIAFLRTLTDLKDTCFRGLHQFVHVLRLVKSHLFDLGSEGNDVTRGRFLGDDLRVVTQVRGRRHATR